MLASDTLVGLTDYCNQAFFVRNSPKIPHPCIAFMFVKKNTCNYDDILTTGIHLDLKLQFNAICITFHLSARLELDRDFWTTITCYLPRPNQEVRVLDNLLCLKS